MPIRGGDPDVSRAAVVGLRIYADGGRAQRTCSGSLIAPNLVLTAQHCIADSPARIACGTAQFGDAVRPSQVRATSAVALCERCNVPWFGVRDVRRPPGDGAVCGEDIALLVLDTPVSPKYASPLTPRVDAPPEPGERYTAVGFGRTSGETGDSGIRRHLEALRVDCIGTECEDPRVMDGEWRGETGACKGDSGGPALDAWAQVIGVSSRGSVDCERPIYSGLTSHRAWLASEGERAAEIGGYEPPAWVSPAHGAGSEP